MRPHLCRLGTGQQQGDIRYNKVKSQRDGKDSVGPRKAVGFAAGHNEVQSPALFASWDTQPLSASVCSSIKMR